MSDIEFRQFSNLPEQEVTRRVYGVESELGTEVSRGMSEPLGVMMKSLAARGVSHVGSFNGGGHLSNGARFYKDVGDHWEYSSAEAQTIAETVGSAIAGEELLAEVVEGFNRHNQSGHHITLNTRVVDAGCETWGSHENYLVPRRLNLGQQSGNEALTAFLATRSPIVGAGVVREYGRGQHAFTLSQKAYGIADTVSGTTTHQKPIVNTKDEPHATAELYRRQHITSGDPTMLPWSGALRLASTSLVLRMLEYGIDLRKIILARPVLAMKDVGKDLSFSLPLTTREGKTITALGVQDHLAHCALRLVERVAVPEEEQVMLQEWIRAIDDLAKIKSGQAGLDVLSGRADWSTKWDMIARTADPDGISGRKSRSIDFYWGELSTQGLARRVRATKVVADPLGVMPRVQQLKTHAPVGRAAVRGEAIRVVNTHVRRRKMLKDASAGWTFVRVETKNGMKINFDLTDPYCDSPHQIATNKRRIARLKQS